MTWALRIVMAANVALMVRVFLLGQGLKRETRRMREHNDRLMDDLIERWRREEYP